MSPCVRCNALFAAPRGGLFCSPRCRAASWREEQAKSAADRRDAAERAARDASDAVERLERFLVAMLDNVTAEELAALRAAIDAASV